MFAYVSQQGLTVLSSCQHDDDPARCERYYATDLDTFKVKLSAEEMEELHKAPHPTPILIAILILSPSHPLPIPSPFAHSIPPHPLQLNFGPGDIRQAHLH